MIGSTNKTADITDSEGFGIAQYYEAVLDAIRESDVYPNSYIDVYASPVSGAMACPCEQETIMSMSCDTLRFIDLNESDLHYRLDYRYKLTAPKEYYYADGQKDYYTYYIGPKRSFDLIGHYLLQSNTDVAFLDQVQSEYESFIDYIATINGGTVEETTATIEKVRRMDPFVPGFYHTMTAQHNDNVVYKKTLEGRIPITDFHCLKDLRWFMSWMGELKFHIYPTVKKWCICPCYTPQDLIYLKTCSLTDDGNNNGNAVDLDRYILSNSCGFNQTDTHFQIAEAGAECNKLGDVFLTSLRISTVEDLELITRQSSLKPNLAAALEQMFVQAPLMFPILNWGSMGFSSDMGTGQSADCATTLALQHCDTGFLLFPRTPNDLTCYINPECEFRLQIGSRLIPQKPYTTVEDHRFKVMFYDGFNIKGNANFHLMKGVYNSLQPYTVYDEAGAANLTTKYIYNMEDRSNFCIPIPFTADEWFQGGLSQPNTPLKLHISNRLKHGNNTSKAWGAANADVENIVKPVFVYAQDHILRIYSAKPGLGKQIDISTRSVEEILATGMA